MSAQGEPCRKCGAPLESTRNAALSSMCAACYAKADDHLVLVRIAIRRWNVIQWWMAPSARATRDLTRDNALVGNSPLSVAAALRTAVARRVPMAGVADRTILVGYKKPMTIAAIAGEPWCTLSVRMRGEPRLLGYELTGSRLRDEG